MTKQQAFDKMVAHLASQGKRCMKHGRCAYRADDGTKCVVGCMISDEAAERVATQNFHQTAVIHQSTWNMLREELALEGVDERAAQNFYHAMQQAHDQNTDPVTLKRALTVVAVNNSLDGGSIDNITNWS